MTRYSEYYLNDSQNFRFFVRKWVPDTQPKALLLLVHGLSDHGGRFKALAETLANEGFVFVAPDLRGNGRSNGIRGHFDSIEQAMDDLRLLMSESRKALPGIPIILYSQSMGGNLAINFALRFPDETDGVVASSPWLRLTRPPAFPIWWIASKLVSRFPTLLISNGLKSRDLCHDAAVCQAYDSDRLIHWKISLSTFFVIARGGEWAIKNAALLKVPLLLMHSASDPITSFGASEEFYKNANAFATFIPFAGLFHELHNEPEKEEVIGKAVKWLNEQLSAI
jgi:alpha-beta hydrolase superfamily lysophospholipase